MFDNYFFKSEKKPDKNVEVDPDEGEEGAGEVDLPLDVDRHVHPHQPLVGQQVRALAAEPQRRVDLLQESEHVHVVDFTPENNWFIYLFESGSDYNFFV